MKNGQKRSTEEKKQFRIDAMLSGVNPYNTQINQGRKSTSRQVIRIQAVLNKNGKVKFINHY